MNTWYVETCLKRRGQQKTNGKHILLWCSPGPTISNPTSVRKASCQQPIYNKVTRCDYDSQSRLLAVGFSLGVLMLFEPLGTADGAAVPGFGAVFRVRFGSDSESEAEIMFVRWEDGFPLPKWGQDMSRCKKISGSGNRPGHLNRTLGRWGIDQGCHRCRRYKPWAWVRSQCSLFLGNYSAKYFKARLSMLPMALLLIPSSLFTMFAYTIHDCLNVGWTMLKQCLFRLQTYLLISIRLGCSSALGGYIYSIPILCLLFVSCPLCPTICKVCQCYQPHGSKLTNLTRAPPPKKKKKEGRKVNHSQNHFFPFQCGKTCKLFGHIQSTRSIHIYIYICDIYIYISIHMYVSVYLFIYLSIFLSFYLSSAYMASQLPTQSHSASPTLGVSGYCAPWGQGWLAGRRSLWSAGCATVAACFGVAGLVKHKNSKSLGRVCSKKIVCTTHWLCNGAIPLGGWQARFQSQKRLQNWRVSETTPEFQDLDSFLATQTTSSMWCSFPLLRKNGNTIHVRFYRFHVGIPWYPTDQLENMMFYAAWHGKNTKQQTEQMTTGSTMMSPSAGQARGGFWRGGATAGVGMAVWKLRCSRWSRWSGSIKTFLNQFNLWNCHSLISFIQKNCSCTKNSSDDSTAQDTWFFCGVDACWGYLMLLHMSFLFGVWLSGCVLLT